ncbi:hypothetical protein B4098_1644 [Heyndrickxia coagulans]|uniref:Uncharacterized protein n=1 Tax=Heyndrickxia coagulans TaxID=1398 RepID=A0A150K783_HEYCO|nr:hypothetical protein B4098_1644 [Heyndrickxia coagulans]
MIHSLFICMFYWQPPCLERDVCYTSRRHEQTETDFIKQRKDEKNQQRGGKKRRFFAFLPIPSGHQIESSPRF